MDAWSMFTIIGTVPFSLQGGMIAMEKNYDLFGVYLFGILTAFGGGAMRNILIDTPDYELWNQASLFYVSIISITLILIFPKIFLKGRMFWGNILDAIGLIAFAIQGSIAAVQLDLPASAVVVSAMLTATGGGIIRDILSQRQPIVLGEVIYGLWVFIIGLIIGFGVATTTLHMYILFVVFSALRISSYVYDWKIPYRHFDSEK